MIRGKVSTHANIGAEGNAAPRVYASANKVKPANAAIAVSVAQKGAGRFVAGGAVKCAAVASRPGRNVIGSQDVFASEMLGHIYTRHPKDFGHDTFAKIIQPTGLPASGGIDHDKPVPGPLGSVLWGGAASNVDVNGGVFCDGLLLEQGLKFGLVILGP